MSRSLKSVCLLLVFALFGCGAVRMNRTATDLQSSKLAYEQCVRAADSVDQCAKEKALQARENRTGLASAMLLGSFGGQAQRSGFSAKDLKLACSRPSLNWSYTDGALLELEERCFYLHSAAAGSLGKRYWFGTKPNLNKLVVQYRQQVSRETYDDEILDAVRRESEKKSSSDATWRVLVNPDKDLAEQRNLTLLVLPPSISWGDEQNNESVKRAVADLSGKCGAKDRTYRNTLLFLAANSKGMGKLRAAYRERAALKGVQTDYGAQLDHEQLDDLKKRLETAEKSAVESLGAAYTIALRVAGQEVESTILGDSRPSFSEHLSFLWQTLVQDEEWVLRKIGPVTLKNVGLVPYTGGIALKDAVEAFLKFTDKPVIASRPAVTSWPSMTTGPSKNRVPMISVPLVR